MKLGSKIRLLLEDSPLPRSTLPLQLSRTARKGSLGLLLPIGPPLRHTRLRASAAMIMVCCGSSAVTGTVGRHPLRRVPTPTTCTSTTAVSTRITATTVGTVFSCVASRNRERTNPAPGYRYRENGRLYSVGGDGYSWSSSIPSDNDNVYFLNFHYGRIDPNNNLGRAGGLQTRCLQE